MQQKNHESLQNNSKEKFERIYSEVEEKLKDK